MRGASKDVRFWERQADATISQANPVSNTFYPVLSSSFVRIYSIYAESTGGTTSALTVRVVADGNTIDHAVNPTSGTPYEAETDAQTSAANQVLSAANSKSPYRAFLHEGKVVVVTAAITWTVQPSPLEIRVKWARYI